MRIAIAVSILAFVCQAQTKSTGPTYPKEPFPIGAQTYIVAVSIWDDGVTFGKLRPATPQLISRVLRSLDGKSPPKPEEETQAKPKSTEFFSVTVTVYSDGATEMGELKPATEETMQSLLDRVAPPKAEEERPPARIEGSKDQIKSKLNVVNRQVAKQTAEAKGPHSQCHARTDAGARCKRTAATNGFCWQHRDAANTYPD